MWFPVDDGMVNLERVALIRIGEDLEVRFFNDARAHLTTASFEEEAAFHDYIERLQQELPLPMFEEQQDHEKFPAETSVVALASSSSDDDEDEKLN